MAKAPTDNRPSRSWNEDTATVIFGDDLVEDFLPSMGAPKHSAPPPPSRSQLLPSTSHLLPPAQKSRPSLFRSKRATLPSPGISSYVEELRANSPTRGSRSALFRFVKGLRKLLPHLGSKSSNSLRELEAPPPPISTYSGLDTLRPYVGSRPQILLGEEDWDDAPPVRRTPDHLFTGFVVGVATASFVFVATTLYSHRSTPAREVRASSDRVHVDADAITPGISSEDDVIVRAKAGEREALSQLKKKALVSLSPEEVAAISRGEEILSRRHTEDAILALAKQDSFSPADRAEFLMQAGSQRTYREALLSMATCESEAGPDLIYDVMRTFRHQEDIAGFARSLLATPQVYGNASRALRVIIDAETLTECSDVRLLVNRVAEDGDARAIRHMAKFAKTTGCGEHGINDCYSCLRGDRSLVEALRRAQARPAPLR